MPKILFCIFASITENKNKLFVTIAAFPELVSPFANDPIQFQVISPFTIQGVPAKSIENLPKGTQLEE